MHSLIVSWFTLVHDWGYVGVFFLMALESTIVPVPSELIMPAAAYWSAQGQMNLSGVIVSGTLGSYAGSLCMYWLFWYTGQRFIRPIVRARLVSENKLQVIEHWVQTFGAAGVFFARLLPVFRHLISIPAGTFRMSLRRFSIATLVGSAFWCSVLAIWGEKILGRHPELLNSPEEMMAAVKKEMLGFVLLIVVVTVLYAFVSVYRQRHQRNSLAKKNAN